MKKGYDEDTAPEAKRRKSGVVKQGGEASAEGPRGSHSAAQSDVGPMPTSGQGGCHPNSSSLSVHAPSIGGVCAGTMRPSRGFCAVPLCGGGGRPRGVPLRAPAGTRGSGPRTWASAPGLPHCACSKGQCRGYTIGPTATEQGDENKDPLFSPLVRPDCRRCHMERLWVAKSVDCQSRNKSQHEYQQAYNL